jgi:hypothetical protein
MNRAELIARLKQTNQFQPNADVTTEDVVGVLERLTAGDVSLPDHPEPMVMKWSELEKKAISDYGARCTASAVLAERDRCAKVCEAEDVVLGDYAPGVQERIAAAIRKGTS